ncbi:MAG TPA: FtsQ-type POTRA domain-containing protein [Gaiellaceae bacterium]
MLRPTLRSLLVALALVTAAGGAYVGARDTGVFAVRSLDVRGGSPSARAEVRAALAPELGRSLVRVGEGELASRLATVSLLASFHYDRAFPHTLRVTIKAERPALVVRQGADAYLVSSTSRVLKQMTQPRLSGLPRMYVAARAVDIQVGTTLPAPVADGAAAVAPLAGSPLPGGVQFVSAGTDGLQLVLGTGFEVRLGDTGDLRLKVAIARRILLATGAAAHAGYLDVSVPERPVLSTNSQVAG